MAYSLGHYATTYLFVLVVYMLTTSLSVPEHMHGQTERITV